LVCKDRKLVPIENESNDNTLSEKRRYTAIF